MSQIAPLTPSLARVVKNFKAIGFKRYIDQIMTLCDTKDGKFAGQDAHGNRFYENKTETLWRHRWVEYSSKDPNAAQIEPEWHSFLHHIRDAPPNVDTVTIASHQKWMIPHHENLTGTRGAFKTYNTAKPKIEAWQPVVAKRV